SGNKEKRKEKKGKGKVEIPGPFIDYPIGSKDRKSKKENHPGTVN
ncbi:unnamed protein product, partial [marine sediment metagenome]